MKFQKNIHSEILFFPHWYWLSNNYCGAIINKWNAWKRNYFSSVVFDFCVKLWKTKVFNECFIRFKASIFIRFSCVANQEQKCVRIFSCASWDMWNDLKEDYRMMAWKFSWNKITMIRLWTFKGIIIEPKMIKDIIKWHHVNRKLYN